MRSASLLVCDELTECVGEARDPSPPELASVAERIWTDCQGPRSVFRWRDLSTEAPGRVRAMRAAHLALCGSVS